MFDNRQIKMAQARMESARWSFDSLRSEIAGFLYPVQSNFQGRMMSQGQSQTDRTYDEYPQQAFEDGVSLALSYTMPRGQRWVRLTIPDEKLMASVANRQWLETIERRLFALRNDPQSGFSTMATQGWANLLAFGMQSCWIDIRRDRATGRALGLSYQAENIDKVYIEVDAQGAVYRAHFKFRLTAEQARLKWGAALPEKVAKAAGEANTATQEFEFVHVIEPNEKVMAGRIDAAGKAWKSCYFSVADDACFAIGGYRSSPRTVSRYARSDMEAYGRSPAMTILPTIRAANIIMQDRIIAAEMNAKKPLLAQDDELDGAVLDLGPFGVTYGGLNERGDATIKPLFEAIDESGMEKIHAQLYQAIDKAFFRDLLQIHREMKTHVSALRTSEEIAEKGVLLDPLSRQEQEWFAPMLARELDLMGELGQLDDMPREIRDWVEAGNGFDIRYDNQLAKMQQAGDVVAYVRTAELVTQMAQFDPSVIKEFTREFPLTKVLPALAAINGVPASWESTEDEKRAIDDRDAQAAQAQQLLEAAPALSQVVKNTAQAEQSLAA